MIRAGRVGPCPSVELAMICSEVFLLFGELIVQVFRDTLKGVPAILRKDAYVWDSDLAGC